MLRLIDLGDRIVLLEKNKLKSKIFKVNVRKRGFIMDVVTIVSGPLIGSLIGYVTNYIAVKMLFRPLNPIKIGSWTLPFTPGILPRRKEQLAKALGIAVGHNLLTGDDLEEMIFTPDLQEVIIQELESMLDSEDQERNIKNILSDYFDQDDYQSAKDGLEKLICAKITERLAKMDIGTIIVKEGRRAIKEKTQGTLLGKMVNDRIIISLTSPIGQRVEEYVREHGLDIIMPIVQDEISQLENQPLGLMAKSSGLKIEHLRTLVEKVYPEFRRKIGQLIKQYDIAGVVEKKVKDMDVLEVEKLVLSVMKRELNAIVNLGGLIGFVLGLLNIFI